MSKTLGITAQARPRWRLAPVLKLLLVVHYRTGWVPRRHFIHRLTNPDVR